LEKLIATGNVGEKLTEMGHEFRRTPSNIIHETERFGTSKTEMGIVKSEQDKDPTLCNEAVCDQRES